MSTWKDGHRKEGKVEMERQKKSKNEIISKKQNEEENRDEKGEGKCWKRTRKKKREKTMNGIGERMK